MTARLSTGVELLDQRLGGGIEPGRVVAFSAPPVSQSELFLARLASTRRTLYLTTKRSESAVESFLDRAGVDVTDCAVRRVDDERPFEHARRLVRSLPDGVDVVVDPMGPFERSDGVRLWNFLNELREHVGGAESLAFLHCLRGNSVPEWRDTTEYMADVVFELRTEVAGDAVENRLLVPKVRGGEPIPDAIKLDLRREVSIDTSRDIA